jgi:hypothetical protein
MRRWLIVLLLAFGWLFSTPAQASPLITDNVIRFSYTWGTVTQTFTDALVTISVTNDITNKIGGNGEVIDTYRITFADQVIEVTEKHGTRDYTFTISGSQSITLEGIDNGFWAGHYGPVMSVSSSPIAQPEEPTTQSPQTESPTQSDAIESPSQSIIWDYSIDEGGVLFAEAPAGKVFSDVVARYVAHEDECGLDVSEVVRAVLVGTSFGTIPATNETFGDPCPGWYKKLIVSVQYSSALFTNPTASPLTESATPTISPEATPTPQPMPEPSPEPTPSPEPIQPQPIPEPTPSETPTASFPTQSPEPEPTQSPTTPSEQATQSLVAPLPTPPATTSPEPQPQLIIEPSPVQSSEGIIEEPVTTAEEVTQVPEEAIGSSLSEAIQATVTQAIGAVTEAVGELVEAFATAGLDMTPEQREEAQNVVVSTVMTSQVAAGVRRIK